MNNIPRQQLRAIIAVGIACFVVTLSTLTIQGPFVEALAQENETKQSLVKASTVPSEADINVTIPQLKPDGAKPTSQITSQSQPTTSSSFNPSLLPKTGVANLG